MLEPALLNPDCAQIATTPARTLISSEASLIRKAIIGQSTASANKGRLTIALLHSWPALLNVSWNTVLGPKGCGSRLLNLWHSVWWSR